MKSIIDPNQSYTFSQFFDLKIEPQELAKYFGYTLSQKNLGLPQYQGELDTINQTKNQIQEILPNISLDSDRARGEFLISPVVLDLVLYTKSEVRIEYQIQVTEQLQGYLSYLLENKSYMIFTKAKNQDLVNGMTQLCAELIALDQWEKTGDQETLLGAVTTGNIWQFAILNRSEKHITQGLEIYRVPEDLEQLMGILVQALI
jgi:hypothetical protein